MTDCPDGDIRDLLPDLLHGRLDAGERAAVEAHLRECADCRDELELLRRMRTALRRAPAVNVERIVAELPPYRAPTQHRPARSWGGWRIAAAVTLLAAGGTSVVVARRGDRKPASVASAPATVATPAPRELALAGGTIGELDDSELSALIDDVGSLDAVTPADVDNAAAAGPIAPTTSNGTDE
ncbi:MAG TPA: anti-sigma factor [Gemmatimonadaceae bacterium]|nr:anti-sigma factor [Gemmatimonadaceae bacterium]